MTIHNYSSFANNITRALVILNHQNEYADGAAKCGTRDYDLSQRVLHAGLVADLNETQISHLVSEIDARFPNEQWKIGHDNPLHKINLYELVRELFS